MARLFGYENAEFVNSHYYLVDLERDGLSYHSLLEKSTEVQEFCKRWRITFEDFFDIVNNVFHFPPQLLLSYGVFKAKDSTLVQENALLVTKNKGKKDESKFYLSMYVSVTNGFSVYGNRIANYLFQRDYPEVANAFTYQKRRFCIGISKIDFKPNMSLDSLESELVKNGISTFGEITLQDIVDILNDSSVKDQYVTKTLFKVYQDGNLFLPYEVEDGKTYYNNSCSIDIKDIQDKDWTAIEERKISEYFYGKPKFESVPQKELEQFQKSKNMEKLKKILQK